MSSLASFLVAFTVAFSFSACSADTTPPISKQVTQRQATKVTVTRVVDGDTVELSNGSTVRVVGIDTPERGQCGYEEATADMKKLVLNKTVQLQRSDENADRYGRLLRYVDVSVNGKITDAGLNQIQSGYAIARYDSRDGYGKHPREKSYIEADKKSKNFSCSGSTVFYPNCDAVRAAGKAPIYTGQPGYGSHLDRDGNGIGCV